jgi:hypothetical protein
VTAITKWLICALPVNRFTVAATALSQGGRTGEWMARFAGLTEKIMNASTLGRITFEDHITLADIQLDVVTGGSGRGLPTSFLAMIGGHSEATWAPRTYAVQSDLSGDLAGGQAGLYERRRS